MRRIFYYCYDSVAPAGGEKHSYQHVDVLNRNGYDAYAYHRTPGMRLSWFDNNTNVIDRDTFIKLYDRDRDVLVFPENLGGDMLRYPGRRVIFNKGVFSGFSALKFGALDPYEDSSTIAVLTVSEHNADYLRLTYPKMPLFRVYTHIRHEVFTPRPFNDKARRIVAPAKELPVLTTLYRMFTARASGRRDGPWEWQVLSGNTESQTAEILADSPIILFLSVHEGLPRLPLEAMSCNCLVGAFRSGPLLEILPTGQGFDFGDLIGLLSWIERITERFPDDSAYREVIAEQRQIARTFSAEKQTESVCAAWESIFRRL